MEQSYKDIDEPLKRVPQFTKPCRFCGEWFTAIVNAYYCGGCAMLRTGAERNYFRRPVAEPKFNWSRRVRTSDNKCYVADHKGWGLRASGSRGRKAPAPSPSP